MPTRSSIRSAIHFMTTVTVANVSPRAILDFCKSKGVSSERLLAAPGIHKRQIAEPGAKVSADQLFALWREAQIATHDALIAAHVAGLVPFGAYGIGDYLLAAAPTPRQALGKLIHAFPLVNGAFELRLTSRGPESSLELHNPYDPEEGSHLHVEFFFALILLRLRHAAAINWHPKELSFTHSPPPQCAGYDEAFQCRVRFNQPANQLALEREFLDFPLPYADPLLSEMLEHHAKRLLKDSSQDHLLHNLRQALHEGFGRGDYSLTAIARKLTLSGRSLQRELHSRGTSYREEVDRFRRDLALEMAPHEPVHEIVGFLRFSEPSSFYRAFRRWTGKTPRQYLHLS